MFDMLDMLPKNVTKKDITHISRPFIDSVEEGWLQPLSVYVKLEGLKRACLEAQDKIKYLALNEAGLYHPQADDRSIHGVDFKVRNGTMTLDYSDDQEWRMLRKKEKDASAARKEREQWLRHLYLNPDPATGEIKADVTIKKHGDASLVLSIK